MRFKLTLEIDKKAFGNALPLNYQYEQSAAVYRILSRSDRDFSGWLHDNGYRLDKKTFKLFNFSRLIVPKYTIDTAGGLLVIHSDTCEWYISFLPQISTEKFIQGMFAGQTFQLGNKDRVVQFHIKKIEILPPPVFSAKEMFFQTLSPICITRRHPDGKTSYLSPDLPESAPSVLHSLLNRYEAFYGKPYPEPVESIPFDFQVLNTPKPVLITFKAGQPSQTRIKGYMCRFGISAPVPLLEIMYDCGAGEKGSLGFGFIKNYGID